MIFHLRGMGHHRRLFLLSLLLLLIISSGHSTDHAQAAAITQQEHDGVGIGIGSMMRAMVGSRPPSCDGRCWWCGGRRCVAVQVPITPQQDSKNSHGAAHGRPRSRKGASRSSSSPAARQQQQQVSSYDDHSNYKPLSWRCKCGGAAPGLNP